MTTNRPSPIAQGFQLRFDGPPGPSSGRFIEAEDLEGQGIKIGEWVEDGIYWLLRFPPGEEVSDAEG